MTNGEAINWIINISADIGKAEHSDLWHYEQALYEIREMIESAQPEQRWIPCSERLPEEYGEYLITWTTSQSKRQFIGISEGEVTSEYDHGRSSFKFEWLLEDHIKNCPDVKVIAWMPLPAPFELKESEG